MVKLSQYQLGQISILQRLADASVGETTMDEIQNMVKEMRLITKEIKNDISL